MRPSMRGLGSVRHVRPHVQPHPWQRPGNGKRQLVPGQGYISTSHRSIQGTIIMVVVYAFSKWVKIIPMMSTTAEVTIRALQRLFACHGFLDVVISDNGPQWTVTIFQTFLAPGHLAGPNIPVSSGQQWPSGTSSPRGKRALGKMNSRNLQDKITR